MTAPEYLLLSVAFLALLVIDWDFIVGKDRK